MIREVDNFKQLPPDGEPTPFAASDVAAVCINIRAKTASGVDDIHPCFLKYGGSAVHNSLTMLLNTIWRLGVFPSAWKRARGVALYKSKGDRADRSNYRLL